jgi:riboflavin kinase
VKRAFEERLGFSPHPGTLNLFMEGTQRVEWSRLKKEWSGINIPPENPSFCRARCFRVLIDGKITAAIVFPEVEGYPDEKLEILAPVHVKQALQVKDGDVLTIEVFEGQGVKA